LRVAVLGGSTAFGTEVTDVETWVAVLQRRLGDEFCVRNYGVPGYSTAEAIIQMALVVPEFQPHFVVVYEGWNDIRNYHDPNISSDYYRHGMEQPENLGLVSGRRGDLFGGFVRRSSLVRMARAVRSRLVSEPEFEVAAGLSSPDPIVDKLFLRNLRTIALLADHFGADALFVPQILNGEYFRGRPGSDVWSPHIRNEAMPVLMDRFNGLMKSVCAGDEPSCLFGQEVLAIDWVPDDFVDGGHFSKSGGEKFAEILSRVILSEIEVKTIEERLVSDSRPAQIN
jgi:lysophospholipase L1-like esterase